jgi:hypothetical protein
VVTKRKGRPEDRPKSGENLTPLKGDDQQCQPQESSPTDRAEYDQKRQCDPERQAVVVRPIDDGRAHADLHHCPRRRGIQRQKPSSVLV